MPASGKSYLGNYASKKTGYAFYDLDAEIEKELNTTIPEFFEQFGELKFRQTEHELLIKITENCTSTTILATGGGTPCFHENMEYMNLMGVTVFLDADIDILSERIEHTPQKRPLFRELNGEDLKKELKILYKIRRPHYKKSKVYLPSHDLEDPDLFTKRLHLSTIE